MKNLCLAELNVIPKNSFGIYHLYEKHHEKYKIIYVGRSDTCLRRRLKAHFKSQRALFFTFEILPDIRSTYNRECLEYHRLVELGVQNLIHPDRPRNLPYSCEYCAVKNQFKNIKL